MWEEIIVQILSEVTWWGWPAALFIIGLFQILKAWGLNPKIVPLCVLGFSVAGGVAWYFFGDHALAKAIADALLVGCAAMGIFSGIKSTIEFFGDN